VKRELHAEWTKLRTLPGTVWQLLAIVVLTAGLSLTVIAVVRYPAAGQNPDTTKLSLTGVYLGQAVVAIVAVLVVCNEYSTGMIRVTLAAMPRRHTVLAAKAAIVGTLTLAAATVAVLASVLAGRLILPGHGFTAANGFAALPLTDGSTLRAAVGTVLYLGLIALLGVGIAALVRDSAASVGAVLGLLYLFPLVAALVPDATLRRHLQQIGPMSAGLAVQATQDLGGQPIGPWAGLGVLAAWAAGALLLGGLVLRVRDA
jgi:ABC-2 type transport system permease protein